MTKYKVGDLVFSYNMITNKMELGKIVEIDKNSCVRKIYSKYKISYGNDDRALWQLNSRKILQASKLIRKLFNGTT